MTPRDNDPLHAPINAKLAETVANLPTAPAWLDAWTALGPESTEDARLAVSLDLETLRELFDRVDNFGWQSAGFPRGDGPFVEIEGVYRGGTVFVQVFASAPEDEEPGMKLDTRSRGG
jgi:hypothetical protein